MSNQMGFRIQILRPSAMIEYRVTGRSVLVECATMIVGSCSSGPTTGASPAVGPQAQTLEPWADDAWPGQRKPWVGHFRFTPRAGANAALPSTVKVCQILPSVA